MSQKISRTFPRGSEWRRWDLHVHTPASVLENQYGSDEGAWDRYVHMLFNKAIRNQISAIGITDYLSIAGYKKLKQEYLAHRSRMEQIFANECSMDPDFLTKVYNVALFPNIEFRIEKYVMPKKGNSEKRLTMHVLFSDEVEVESIEQNFLGQLHITYIGSSQSPDEKWPLTSTNLEKLGQRLKEEHAPFQGETAAFVGYMQAAIDDEEISMVLSTTQSLFGNKYLLVLAEEYLERLSWDGSGHQPKKVLYQKSDMIFSANPGTIARTKSQGFAEEFGAAKPCIWGSDAHSVESLFEPAEQRYCWIKADVTFSGLKQIVIEPERCYIGEHPPALQLLKEHKKPHIQSISFKKNSSSLLREKWFDGLALEFNSGMVTIIGNKGAGKSALADSLALLGVPKVGQNHFGFLRDTRFKRRDASSKVNRAEEFEAELVWNTGERVAHQLSYEINSDDLQRVHYLPQGYLERLCNEQEEDAQAELRNEIDRVIFSHVKTSERLGKNSLAELIDYRADGIIRSISSLKRHLRDINHKIVGIEQKITRTAYAVWDEKIKAKETELQLHENNKPVEVPDPKADKTLDAKGAENLKQVEEISRKIAAILDAQTKAEQDLLPIRIKREKAKKALERLNKFQQYLESTLNDIDVALAELGIEAGTIISAQIDKTPFEKFVEEIDRSIASMEAMFNANNADGYSSQLRTLEQKKKSLQSVLDAPNLQYQRYRTELSNWERRRKELLGTSETPDTLLYYKQQLDDIIYALPKRLAELKTERQETALKIHLELCGHANVCRDYYRPVMDYVNSGSAITDSFKVSLEVVIDGASFVEQFFERIKQDVSGSFCGVTEGRKRLVDMMQSGRFDDGESTLGFIEEVISALSEDQRSTSKSKAAIPIEKQLRKSHDLESLYNFLYSMEYLKLKYVLRVGNKGLQELSPGERGLLLLYFYLVIDRDNCPLIIDQPEENLDNQSIKNILVPCIKAAKERRQLFIITHNPNIAVVCDSEQIILASIDKTNSYEILCSSGSIENGIVSRYVVDVLEGTPPAFENRNLKYRTGGAIPGLRERA